MRSGDSSHAGLNVGTTERCELGEEWYKLPANTTAYYGFSIRIPASQLSDCGVVCGEWRNLMQWHLWREKEDVSDYWSHHPPLVLALDDGKLSFIMTTTGDDSDWDYIKIVNQASFEPDLWIDFVVQIEWSKTPNSGSIKIWKDGVPLALDGDINKFASGYSKEDYTGIFLEAWYLQTEL